MTNNSARVILKFTPTKFIQKSLRNWNHRNETYGSILLDSKKHFETRVSYFFSAIFTIIGWVRVEAKLD